MALPASVFRRRISSASSLLRLTSTPFFGMMRGVVRDRVVRLHLVRPPVAEGGRAGAVRRDLLGHLVALEHVLERADLEAELVGDAQQHQDLVGAVAVGVDVALALEHLLQRLRASGPCAAAAASRRFATLAL